MLSIFQTMSASYPKKIACTWMIIMSILLTACVSKTSTSAPFLTTTTKGTIAGATAGAMVGSLGGIPGVFGAAVGGAAGTIIGHDISKRELPFEILNQQLDHRYVRLITLGQQITFVVSTDRLFYEGTPRLRRSEYATLSLIAKYIRQFKTEGVHVAAFTSRSGNPAREIALTEQQAQNVLHFLWKEKLGSPILTGMGYGSSLPIASDNSIDGRIENRRIEIQFQWIAKVA